MREINTREDYEAVVEKYAARLKVARSKYDDFKKEVDALEKALATPAPKEASEAERKDYANLVKSSLLSLKDLRRMIGEYDDLFDTWTRSVKLFR
jgi:hypothetical protein